MKPVSLLIWLYLLCSSPVSSAPDISMEIYRFRTDTSAYIEVSLYVVGSSLACEQARNSNYGVSYVILVKNELEHVVAGNKYKLSREGCPASDIFDVRRFTLPAGKYTIDLEVNDLSDSLNSLTVTQIIEIPAVSSSSSLSDVQLLSNIKTEPEETSPFHKSGLYLEPLPFRLYYPLLSKLWLYHEAYQTDQLEGQPYMQYTIKPVNGDIPAPIVTYKKLKKEPVSASVLQLDISQLITGPYIMEAALYDGNRQLIEQKTTAFTRLNPSGDSLFLETAALNAELGFANDIPEDSLDYSLRAIAPIVNSLDNEVLNTLLKKGSSKSKRYFIHKFWTTQSGKLAGPAFESYMAVANVVDKTYRSGFGYGFETDRGYVFLKYGKPNDVIAVEDEPSAPPYEIWFYNTFPATHQTNVRFLFYNPSLVKNGHELLHSTARGEVNNPRWEVELYKDATLETPGVDQNVMGDNVHRNARTYFEN